MTKIVISYRIACMRVILFLLVPIDTKLLILRCRLDIKKPPPKWKKTI